MRRITAERAETEPSAGGSSYMDMLYGATLYKGESVTGITSNEGVTVTTDQRTVFANKLLISAGNWNGELLGKPFENLLRVYRQKLFWFELEESGSD